MVQHAIPRGNARGRSERMDDIGEVKILGHILAETFRTVQSHRLDGSQCEA